MKAILVIDIPENCFKCKLQDWANCRIVKGCHTGDTRPDWCPLSKMPSKYAEKDFTPIKDERYDNGYEDGYNACIDEILGDNE